MLGISSVFQISQKNTEFKQATAKIYLNQQKTLNPCLIKIVFDISEFVLFVTCWIGNSAVKCFVVRTKIFENSLRIVPLSVMTVGCFNLGQSYSVTLTKF